MAALGKQYREKVSTRLCPEMGIPLHKKRLGSFPSGPVVKNLPVGAGDLGSISDLVTKIPRATGQLNWCATTTEPYSPVLHTRRATTVRSLHTTARESPRAATKAHHSST